VAEKLADLGAPLWLSPGRAFDIAFKGDAKTVLASARASAEGLGADINVVATKGRKKKLLVSDMESTIISCECLDELAEIAEDVFGPDRVHRAERLDDAIALAVERAESEVERGGGVVVTGSLYLVAEARILLGRP